MLVHSDGGVLQAAQLDEPAVHVREGTDRRAVRSSGRSRGQDGDTLRILIEEIHHDTSHDLGVDPGLQKDGVEKHLQELLAEHPATLSEGLTLVRREYPTAIGPVDLMCRDAAAPRSRSRSSAAARSTAWNS